MHSKRVVPAGIAWRGSPVLRGALLAALGLLVGPRAWAVNITTCPFTISAAGDYHVTQDLTCSSTTKPAITVNASNVTLSLDGHTITGPGRTQFQAVGIDFAEVNGVQVTNGTIASFGVAVELELETTSSSVSGLTVRDCDDGVSVDHGAHGNSVLGNSITSGDVGIAVGGSNNTVSGNTSSNNETGISINDDAAHGNDVEGNTALGNSSVDLEDVNANCDSNTWMNNCFGTKSQSCIGISTCGQGSITCPPNQTVTVPATSHPTATVDAGTPTTNLTGVPVVGVRSDGKAVTDPYPAGTTTITWTVNPGQENAATCTQTITVLVGNGPSIICPASQTVTAAAGQNSATVVVGMATLKSEGATVTGVRSDGKALTAPYPVGTTTITWIGMDARGEVARCTQTIIVQAALATPPILRLPATADPHIVYVFVNRGPLQQRAIIHGSGFADLEGTSYVTMAGHQIPVLAWSNEAIDVVINPGAGGQSALAPNAAYPLQVIIPDNGKKSNTVDFFLTDGPPPDYPNQASEGLSDQPVFGAFQKTLFCPGDTVAFLGSGFGAAQGTGFVTVTVPQLDQRGNPVSQALQEPVLGWSENAINFLLDLPAGAAPGIYTATVHRGNGKTATGSFLVGTRDSSGQCVTLAPAAVTISSASCNNGGVGVTLNGTGFGAVQGAGAVTLTATYVDAMGGITHRTSTLSVVDWTGTRIDALVPGDFLPNLSDTDPLVLTVTTSGGATSSISVNVHAVFDACS